MLRFLCLSILALTFTSCSDSGFGSRSNHYLPGNLGKYPTPEQRKTQIATEERGDFYYGRRYYVQKTRFWGYLRKPGQSAKKAQLVIFNEAKKRNPDRLPEAGAPKLYGFDQNYEYKIYGRYTGRTLYEPNSNQFLSEFLLTDYKLVSKYPSWLFSPNDFYSPTRLTLLP
ncbi:hypothetical protein N9A94_08275 [Akkermansiaceae bacterium]|nr:hypothetical protein [Akkermansiaceae bacterium]MDA7888033.1 hypothetical protein [Akkermansiaceae bacterium]